MTADFIGVVVADDHDRFRRGLGGMLAAADGLYVLGEARDGVEAVDLALSRRPHVVLMDLNMPGLDGLEATRRIMAADARIRVIVLTAFGGREREALEAGAAMHLLKDTLPEELVGRVRDIATDVPR